MNNGIVLLIWKWTVLCYSGACLCREPFITSLSINQNISFSAISQPCFYPIVPRGNSRVSTNSRNINLFQVRLQFFCIRGSKGIKRTTHIILFVPFYFYIKRSKLLKLVTVYFIVDRKNNLCFFTSAYQKQKSIPATNGQSYAPVEGREPWGRVLSCFACVYRKLFFLTIAIMIRSLCSCT